MVIDIRSLAPGQIKPSLGKTEKSKRKPAGTTSSSASADAEDSVSLTGQASQIQSLIQQMKAAPAVDLDRVYPVKEKVDQGDYEIRYQQVANKMLDFEVGYQGY